MRSAVSNTSTGARLSAIYPCNLLTLVSFRSLAGHINGDADSSASSLFDSDSDVNAPHLSALETLNQLPGSDTDVQAVGEAQHDLDTDSGSSASSGSLSRWGLHASDSDRRVRRRHANSPGPASAAGAADQTGFVSAGSGDHREADAVFRLPNYSHILEKGHTSFFTLKGIWYCICCKQSMFCGLNVLLQVWGRIR
jgi:hypothetical protein